MLVIHAALRIRLCEGLKNLRGTVPLRVTIEIPSSAPHVFPNDFLPHIPASGRAHLAVVLCKNVWESGEKLVETNALIRLADFLEFLRNASAKFDRIGGRKLITSHRFGAQQPQNTKQ